MSSHQLWWPTWAFLALLANCSLALEDFPIGACSVQDQACEIHENNLVASFPGVASVEECRQLCSDDQQCSHFSHFGQTSFPIGNFCILLSACPTLHPCEDCITEDRWCGTICGDDVEGFLGENVVQLLADVPEELDCKQECNNNTECKFYTYHNGSDPNYPKLCFLLTHLEEPFEACSHCSTGTARCTVDTVCGFLNGTMVVSEALIFTNTGATQEVKTVSVGRCEANILAIGGGGRGGSSKSGGRTFGGGGGSGHVIFTSHMLQESSNLLLNVGDKGESTSVTTEDGSSVILAPAGKDGVNGSYDGASGYSGGGGDGSGGSLGSGGSDGSDGEAGSDGHGGKGSGVDISAFELTNFVLTPGSGGDHACGGGGGGLLINGKGPEFHSGMGEGYGGGGEGCNYSSRYGSSGAILMEIKK